MPNAHVWAGLPVFLTGHTGFKGSWLALWLAQYGAAVHGYALDPTDDAGLYCAGAVAGVMASDVRGDLADRARLQTALQAAQPRVLFHLAAQSLVRASYVDPIGTLLTNVMGTAHVLEAARAVPSLRAVVVVTTDKVYANREHVHHHRESDALGGHDLYSASKAAAELVSSAYRASFFRSHSDSARIATARAGNVIGGGDWAADRLIPDCVRAFMASRPVRLRFPASVRPWQHVLEPLSGYLILAERLLSSDGDRFTNAWNFGPDMNSHATVFEVARTAAAEWGGEARVEIEEEGEHPHEAALLSLDSGRARSELPWQPRWNLDAAVRKSVAWYREYAAGTNARELCARQLSDYLRHPAS